MELQRICLDIEIVMLLDNGIAPLGYERCIVGRGLSGLHNSWGITFRSRSTDPVGRCSCPGPRKDGGFSYSHELHQRRWLEE